jgi:hypothetical protein
MSLLQDKMQDKMPLQVEMSPQDKMQEERRDATAGRHDTAERIAGRMT